MPAPEPRTLPCSGQADALHDHSPGFVCPFLVVSPGPCGKTKQELAKKATASASGRTASSRDPAVPTRQFHGSLTSQGMRDPDKKEDGTRRTTLSATRSQYGLYTLPLPTEWKTLVISRAARQILNPIEHILQAL